ncbi:hypothetical protein JY409_14200, partial [Stenotrophomonas maltophilia]|nr:hypothetical protein [Stenotrophomonas maltophilia]
GTVSGIQDPARLSYTNLPGATSSLLCKIRIKEGLLALPLFNQNVAIPLSGSIHSTTILS